MDGTNEKALYAFMDILGYGSLLSDDQIYSRFSDAIKRIIDLICNKNDQKDFIPLPNKIDRSFFNKTGFDHDKLIDELMHLIQYRFIFDTFLIILDMKDLNNFLDSKLIKATLTNNSQLKSYAYKIFFYLCSYTYCTLTELSGLLLRGGIAFDHHKGYKQQNENNFFIWSKAHVNAYLIEKRAKDPRIILDNNTIELINSHINNSNLIVYMDRQENCLNIYYYLELLNDTDKDCVASRVKRSINNFITNRIKEVSPEDYKKKIYPKYIYFTKYHNSKMISWGEQYKQYLLNIPKVPK